MKPTGKTVMTTYDTSSTDPYYVNVCQPHETLSHQQQQLPTLPAPSDLSTCQYYIGSQEYQPTYSFATVTDI
jgi:hypothetical protein